MRRIKIFIQHLGITTAEFCRKTGLSRQTVDKFKAGIHGPRVESLDRIIKIYPELRLNWLVTGEGMMIERPPDDEEHYMIRMYEMEVKSKNNPRLTMSFVSAVKWFAQEHEEWEQLDINSKAVELEKGEIAAFRASLLLKQHQRRLVSEILRRSAEKPRGLLDMETKNEKLRGLLDHVNDSIQRIINLLEDKG